MSRLGSGSVVVLSILIALAFLLALFLPLAHAAGQMALPPAVAAAVTAPLPVQPFAALDARALAALQVDDTATLTVAIHSSPIAVRDNNDVTVSPRVFVVHAVVTNTSDTVTATELVISLDYQAANEWVLVAGEEPQRTPDSLAPGEAYHAYWFASYPYPTGDDLSHQYEISASAANAALVSTTENAFDRQSDRTVLTASYIDTGNNGQIALSTEITVGVAFTMSVGYDLGTGAQGVIFSPVGNLDFDASRLRLQAVSVRFHNAADTLETIIEEQLYFPTLPLLPNLNPPRMAEVTYTFVALQAGNNTLCPYLGIDYGTTQKYDNQYCDEGNAAEIIGTIGFDFDKQVSDLTVQEGDTLTYTLHYTNTGTFAMLHTWIWDAVDPQIGQIIAATINPAPDPSETTDNLVAWALGTVAGGTDHTFTFAIEVDAPTADLEDGQEIVNHAFLGINDGSLPDMAATTATVTTTVIAPSLVATKSDGLDTVDAGEELVYTIVIANDGSVAAVNLSATDELPDELQLAGTPSPPISDQTGQLLTWDALPDLPPGEAFTITVPVMVAGDTPSYTTLTNDFELDYHNPAGHLFQPLHATDTTTVIRRAAFVQGYVFDDTNGNGLFDAGESGIENVQLSLAGAFTPTVTTNPTGFYRFRVESDGVYTLTETDPAGYISTTPNRVTLSVVRGQTYDDVNFGDRAIDGESAAIYGTVFADADGDGLWDGDEPGIPNVTVALDGVTQVATDGYGRYSFGIVTPGPHTVAETDPQGYVSTTPNQVTVTAMADEYYQVDFGDIAIDPNFATIHGTVFSDDNGNGAWDDFEPGIEGVTVTLDDDDRTTTTNSYGRYWFLGVDAGLHTVEETDPLNYISTTPNHVTVNAILGELHEVNFGDTPPDGTIDFDFAKEVTDLVVHQGETLIYTLRYTNTGDLPLVHNWIWDEVDLQLGEIIPGTISPAPEPAASTGDRLAWYVRTLPPGESRTFSFSFRVDGAGTHLPDGQEIVNNAFLGFDEDSLPTNPEATATITSTVAAPDLIATKTDGLDTVAPGEELTYTIVIANEGSAAAVDFTATDLLPDELSLAGPPSPPISDQTGQLLTWDPLPDLPPGEAFTITIPVVVDGDTPSYTTLTNDFSLAYHNPAGHLYQPLHASDTTTVMRPAAFVQGYVFADTNGNGLFDAVESGIEGVELSLPAAFTPTVHSGPDGSYAFRVESAGVHTVSETDPPNHISTTPNEVTLDVVLGKTYEVNFGDVMLGTGSCPSDQFEEDDSYLVANPLNPGTVYTHDFCGDPEDWHAVTVERGYIYTFTTSAFGVRADTFLALYDGDGTTLLAANDDFAGTTDFSSQIVWTAPDSGTYYLRITNRTGLTEWLTGYDVWVEHEPRYALFLPYVTVTPAGSALRPASTLPLERTRGKLLSPLSPQAPSGIIDHCNPDAFEVDDTWEQARPVLPGVLQLHTFDSNPDINAADKDFVAFEVGPGGSIAASVASTSTTTLLELYNDQGQALHRTGIDQLAWDDAPIGRYYLGVSSVEPAYACDGSVSYELTVDYTPHYRLMLPYVLTQ